MLIFYIVLTPIGFSFSGQFSILADAGEELNSFYVDRLKATASLFGGKIIYSYNGTLTDDVIQDYLMKTIDIKNFAVATLVVINNKQTLIDFMDKRKIQLDTLSMIDANEVPHMYPLFFLPGSLDYSVLQDPLIKPHLVGCYFVTGFTGLETYNITAEYKANYTNVNFNDPSGYEYAVIGGVLDGFIDINKKYPTNRVQSLLPLIYNKPLPYPGGELYILPSNYITLPLTYIRILTAGGYYSTTFIVPHDLDFEINSYYGSINTETCNFKINPVSGISTIDSLPIAFILDMSTYKNKLIRLYIDKMVADTV